MLRKLGFTLAEVLITLGIIGVVAAMTIPTLITQTNDAEFRSGLKKVLSTLNQAITMNMALDDTDFSALTSGDYSDTNTVLYMFGKRMRVGEGSTAAFSEPFTAGGNNVAFFNDGMAISISTESGLCTEENKCSLIVDVNGNKRPNTLSVSTDTTVPLRDQFVLDFYNQQVVPHDEPAKYVLFNTRQ